MAHPATNRNISSFKIMALSVAVGMLLHFGPAASVHAMGERPAVEELREVGRVLTTRGDVSARQPDDDPRALGRGDHIYEGDTLLTGENGRAQVRFVDEGLVQLQPGTEYFIEHYREDESERGAFTRLVEGGLRAMSGSIGRQDREQYRLDTPVASIGIRGTHYALRHCGSECEADLQGTVGGVLDGRIAVSNAGGEMEFGRNEFFAVPDENTPARRLTQPPAGLLDSTDAEEADEDEDDEEDALGTDEAEEASEEEATEDGSASGDDRMVAGSDDGDMFTMTSPEYRATDDAPSEEQAGVIPGLLGVQAGWRYHWFSDGEFGDDDDMPLGFQNELAYGLEMMELELSEEEFEEILTSLEGFRFDITTRNHADGTPILMQYRLVHTFEEGSSSEMTLRARDGISASDIPEHGGHDPLGVSWGRWEIDQHELITVIDGETTTFQPSDEHTNGNWHWIMLDDAERITSDIHSLANLGEQSFSWDGGIVIDSANGTSLTGEGWEFFFNLGFDFSEVEFTFAEFGAHDTIHIDTINGQDVLESGGFYLSLEGESGFLDVDGLFLGDDADGLATQFEGNIMDGELSINGVSLLLRDAPR